MIPDTAKSRKEQGAATSGFAAAGAKSQSRHAEVCSATTLFLTTLCRTTRLHSYRLSANLASGHRISHNPFRGGRTHHVFSCPSFNPLAKFRIHGTSIGTCRTLPCSAPRFSGSLTYQRSISEKPLPAAPEIEFSAETALRNQPAPISLTKRWENASQKQRNFFGCGTFPSYATNYLGARPKRTQEPIIGQPRLIWHPRPFLRKLTASSGRY